MTQVLKQLTRGEAKAETDENILLRWPKRATPLDLAGLPVTPDPKLADLRGV